MVYGQEIGDAFFALLDDSLVVDVGPYAHSAPTLDDTLGKAISKIDGQIAYDDFRHLLSHQGLMTAATQTALKNVDGVSDDFKKAVDALFARSEDAKGSFFTRYQELEPIYDKVLNLDHTLKLDVEYTHSAPTLDPAITAADGRITYDKGDHRLSYAGVLTAARRDTLKNVPDVTLAFQSAVDALFALSQGKRGEAVLTDLQPELSRRRKRQQALQRLSAAAAVDPEFTQALMDRKDPKSGPYPLHATQDRTKSALEDVLALETPGLEATFFFRNKATAPLDHSVPAAANLNYASRGSNPLPNPGNTISGIWSGQVEMPEAGFYNFIIEADSEATVMLTLDGEPPLELTRHGNVRRNTKPLELKAGILYDIELKVENIKDALSLKWETPKRAREVIPSRYLYPPTIFEPFSVAHLRFLKAASLASSLDLTADEMAYLATHADYRINEDGQLVSDGGGWLNALPNADNLHLSDPTEATVAKTLNAALLAPLQALLDFARIKAEISPGDSSLLATLKDPTTATQNADSLLFTITHWDRASLNEVLARFTSSIAGLGHFELFRRVYDAFALMGKMGIPARTLIDATTNEPTADTVRALQEALRARYDPASWRNVVQPINDEMRSLQRDALVAYILHQMRSHPESAHIDTPDKLFEYFLMDVQMDPCMQTSRIRHALSSVQLFIERCLMNLEPRASAAAINAKQWEWMKRYRVWEANRKVYLFPENWLEPELRDDKSPFFKEIESELLQSDITEDSAATALLNYLSKLAEVAHLEPCGIYHIPDDDGKRTGEINHVVARSTAGATSKYYYRRYEYGYWTPWEQIQPEIDDNPVMPVVWKDRLFLFWLRILTQPLTDRQSPQDPPSTKDKNLAQYTPKELEDRAQATAQKGLKVNVQAVLCWSEYYNGKWQATRTSDVHHPEDLGIFAFGGPGSLDRSTLWLTVYEEDGSLVVEARSENGTAVFQLYNTHSLPVPAPSRTWWPHGYKAEPSRYIDTKTDTLNILYGSGDPATQLERQVLKNGLKDRAVTVVGDDPPGLPPRSELKDPFDAPFFYGDSRHVFYVTTIDTPKWVRDHEGIGVFVLPGVASVVQKLPPLVVESGPAVPSKFWGDRVPIVSDLGVFDPAPMRRFVTEDVYIHQALGMTEAVRYGDRQIGPSGNIGYVQPGV